MSTILSFKIPGEPRWLNRVREGDLTAFPKSFRWSTSAQVAHLIDGYGLAGGFERLFPLMRHVEEEIEADRGDRVPALHLWMALFANHRGYRHSGYPPAKAERLKLDRLCQELRAALLRLDDAARSAIVSQFGCEGVPGGEKHLAATRGYVSPSLFG